MDRLEWVALAWHAQLGAATFHRLVKRFGSPSAVSRTSHHELLSSRVRLRLEDLHLISTAMEAAPAIADEVAALEADGVQVLCPFDAAYPRRLLELPAPPPVLCLKGTWMAEPETPAVAIVGTRLPTTEGTCMARRLACTFAERGISVVSGLAIGIDTAAHEGALLAGGQTVAVLGSGIRVIHPWRNRELAAAIISQGALMSESPPRARPSVRSLMARNRLQSALSDAIIVVESRESGGSLQTAAHAKRQGRLVYAVDWQRDVPQARGTSRLLRTGALPIRALDDVPDVIDQINSARQHQKAEHSSEPRQLPLL